MNIEKIMKDCPTAWKEFLKSIRREKYKYVKFINRFIVLELIEEEFIHFRTLYDFFASEGILFDVSTITYIDCNQFLAYDITILLKDNENNIAYEDYALNADLTGAEYKAFTRAFEILNNKLRGGE